MTNEEARAWLEHHFDPLPDGTKQSEAVSLAIKALEHDGVLQEIRHEIEDEYNNFYNRSDIWTERCCGIASAIEIIDRYLDKIKMN